MNKRLLAVAACGVLAFGVTACGDDDEGESGAGATGSEQQDLSGTIRADGSSTVAPLSEAAAELFQGEQAGVRVTVGTSGTGGGFEKFCNGETDISDASREIKDEEIAACKKNGIAQEQVTVANDALSVVVHPDNPVNCVTVEQLSQMWDRGSKVNRWEQVDGLEGDKTGELALYGPGTDSGTFDYFTEAINGEEGQQRSNYNNIGEDDNGVINGVAGNEGGLGYVGYSYVTEAGDKIKALQIKNPDTGECVAPSVETVQDSSYKPLGRELYVYPSDKALAKPEVVAFLKFYVDQSDQIAEAARFIPMTDEQKRQSLADIDKLAGGAPASDGASK